MGGGGLGDKTGREQDEGALLCRVPAHVPSAN